jgi:DNA-binding CsgD family transcriptional regulator
LSTVGDTVGRRTVIGFLGDIALDRGDFAAARAEYARARALVETDADSLDLGFWHANIGRVAARSGALGEADDELRQAIDHLRSAPEWYQGHVLVQLGSLARRRGDLGRARELLVEALGYLQRYRATIEVIDCLDELGRLAFDHRDHQRAATLYAAATALRDASGLRLAEGDRATNAAAIDAIRLELAPAAFIAAWELGMAFSLDEAAAFASASDDQGRSGRQRRPGSPLTPREREIAELIARGMTNRQIAEQLVIAHGTVRIHVERMLGKLGLTSRVQIATRVTRHATLV